MDVEDFFQPFSGKFKGRDFSSARPQGLLLGNAAVCDWFGSFVSHTLEEWIPIGAVRVVSWVGEVELPKMVILLTVEP